MTNDIYQTKIFFGWWVVLVTGIVSGLSMGFYVYGISALFKPIALELGLTRAATSGAAGIGIMAGGLLAPLVGRIVDTFGPRQPILGGLFLFVAGLILMNFVSSVWGFYLVWGVMMGVGVNLGLTIAIDKALTDWFVRKIGLAIGTKFAVIGIVSAVSIPVISWLIAQVGWRTTCLLWSVLLLIGIPFILTFVKNKRPEHYGLLPDGDKDDLLSAMRQGLSSIKGRTHASVLGTVDFSLRQAIRTNAYWLLTASFIIQFFIIAGFTTHCIPLLTEMDINPIVAGSMMGMMLLFTIPSRFISGLFADRVRKERLNLLMIVPFLLIVIGIGIFLITQRSVTIFILLILYGIAHGLPTPLFIVIVSRYFGRKAFGSIFGITFMLMSPVALLSPILTGWIFDTTGSYTIALMLFALSSVFVALLLSFLKAPLPVDR
ncbi:MAG: MFS transporter [Deltaproteobacteria bacterium]|nr:MFS transporter [Deltaproteobacteria bacterium]